MTLKTKSFNKRVSQQVTTTSLNFTDLLLEKMKNLDSTLDRIGYEPEVNRYDVKVSRLLRGKPLINPVVSHNVMYESRKICGPSGIKAPFANKRHLDIA